MKRNQSKTFHWLHAHNWAHHIDLKLQFPQLIKVILNSVLFLCCCKQWRLLCVGEEKVSNRHDVFAFDTSSQSCQSVSFRSALATRCVVRPRAIKHLQQNDDDVDNDDDCVDDDENNDDLNSNVCLSFVSNRLPTTKRIYRSKAKTQQQQQQQSKTRSNRQSFQFMQLI
jgi:hypothetical protein